jgi:hypothetical protein
VIGCNVLDNLNYDKLDVAIKTIHNQLKPNGLFIHLADANYSLPSYIHWLVSDKPDSVFFPGIRGSSGFTALRINKIAYEQILNDVKKEINGIERAILMDWSQNPSNLQAKAIYRFVQKYALQEFDELDNRISEIFGDAIERISLQEPFEISLKAAMENCGFEGAWSYVEGSIAIPADDFKKSFKTVDLFYNSLSVQNGTLQLKTDPALPTNQVLMEGNMRVLIAKKIER